MDLSLVYAENPILTKPCVPIKEMTQEVFVLAKKMIEKMDEVDGIGLASNQIGYSLQLYVIHPATLSLTGKILLPKKSCPKVCINPHIEIFSGTSWKKFEEGCLSFPGLFVEVDRPTKIYLCYNDIEGNRKEEVIEGFEARQHLHEWDHLRGVCFTTYYRGSKESLKKMLQEMKSRIPF